jgi:hypothetical protein
MNKWGTGTENQYTALNGGMEAAEETWQQAFENRNRKANDEAAAFLQQYAKKERKVMEELNAYSKKLAKSANDFKIQRLEEYRDRGMSAEMAMAKANQDAIAKANEMKRQGISEQYKQEKALREAALKANKAQKNKETAENKNLNRKEKRAANAEARKQYREKKSQLKKEEKDALKTAQKKLRAEGATRKEAIEATGMTRGQKFGRAVGKTFSENLNSQLNKFVNSLKQMFDSTIQTYGTYQAKINTRLQGSGTYWNDVDGNKGIESTIKNAIGATPYVKLQTVMDNVVTATENGIAYNIEQRAFLQTISENIASTFNAFDSNLLRIIRLQQSDSTAARLGMEAGLTSFYNSLFQDSSYLNSAYDTVSSNLTEATSQMDTADAVAFEYVVQKWLGSLYSVGASDSAVSKISQALGYLGSGNVSALSSDTAMQSLLVMAASRANLNYSDLLTGGLTANTTNKLLESMVEYLAEIADSGNNVIKSEYANLFGMTVSDLKAVSNVSSSVANIADSMMSYGDAYNELASQMNQITNRLSLAGKLQNLYDNFNYSTATSIAGNPALYAMWQITSAIEDLTGGINLPTISMMGNSVALNTTLTNLMRLGIVGVGTLGGIGSLITGLSSVNDPSSMLSALGIKNEVKTITRGSGFNRKNSGTTTSGTTYIGNESGNDYYQGALASANEETDTTLETAKAKSTEIALADIHEYLLTIFDPKITQMEQMLAAIAGYGLNTDSWGSFTTTANANLTYSATKVSLSPSTGDATQTAENKAKQLSDIHDNVANIYTLLQRVVLGNALQVNVNNVVTTTGIVQ